MVIQIAPSMTKTSSSGRRKDRKETVTISRIARNVMMFTFSRSLRNALPIS